MEYRHEKENWRNLLLKTWKIIIIMILKVFALENDVSVKKMFFHVCQMGLKNPNAFNTALPAKHKAKKCWFTDRKQVTKRNRRHFVGLVKTRLLIHKKYWGLKSERALFIWQENNSLGNKEETEKPWKRLYWAALSWSAVSIITDLGQDLTLETCKIPCELSNLEYILVVDLCALLFFH